MTKSTSRTARIFLSGTFRDFGEERDLLVRRVFPGLRTKLKGRFNMKSSPSRTARIFLSSTFRDFGEARDNLVRRVFQR
jgi:hypothetical protein